MSFAFASFPPVVPRALRATLFSVAGLILVGAPRVSAQTVGTRDPSFTSAVSLTNLYSQYLEYINGTPVLFAGGDAGAFGLLSANGVLYPSEEIGDFGNGSRIVYTEVAEVVPHSATDPSHYVLVGGLFGRTNTQIVNKRPGQNIVRLSPVGAVDTTFDPGTGADNEVTAILPLPDGGMVVGGQFGLFNQQPHEHIVRLNGAGAIAGNDVFSTGLNFDAAVLSLAAQRNPGSTAFLPQILVAGLFSSVNGTPHAKLARINADGSVDASFHPSFDDRTTVVVSQPDGKILVGGDFSNVNGTAAKHIVRLNYDGSIDPTFTASVTGQPAGLPNPPAVYVIQLLNDGSMYLGGNFTRVNGVTRNYLARVDANGVLDPAFDAGKTILNAVQSLSIQADGRLLVGENLSKSLDNSSTRPPSLIRLFAESPSVTLVASTPTATETDSVPGAFTVSRTGNTTNAGPLTVYFQLTPHPQNSRTIAQPRVNYLPLALTQYKPLKYVFSLTIPAGQESVVIPVVPSGRLIKKGDRRSVNLTLIDDPTSTSTYDIVPDAASGSVIITNE